MTLRLAVLGDSIAHGVGARHADHTLASRITADLRGRGVSVHPRVFAVSGARSADLGHQVDRALAWVPHVALVVIGANDLTHFVPVESAAADLRGAVRRLRLLGAEVVVAPAPDLSIVPHVPPALRPVVREGSAVLRRAQVRVTLEEGGRVADEDGSTSSAFAEDRSLFSGDRFHPSSSGYGVIAASLLPVVHAAAHAASS